MFEKFKNNRKLKKLLQTQNNEILIASSKIDDKLLESFKSCIIWPTYTLSKKMIADLTSKGYTIIHSEFNEKFLNSKLFKNNHQQIFYYLDDLLSGEVIKVFYLTDNDNIKLYINTSLRVSKQSIITFDLDKLVSNDIINRTPITRNLDEKFIDTEYGCIKANKSINVFLIGYDEVNKELLKSHVYNNQLVAKYENGYESLKVKYFVMNDKINTYERDLIRLYNQLKERMVQLSLSEYFVMFEDIGRFFYYEGDPSSEDAMELFKYCIDNDNSYNYFYISKDLPEEFIKTFKEHFKHLNNYQFIVNSPKKLEDDSLIYYCNYKQAIESHFTTKEKFKETYDIYCQVVKRYLPYYKSSIEDMEVETIEFIKSQFRNLHIKFAMLGLDCVNKENSNPNKVITIKQYKELISKYKNSIYVEEDSEYINQYVQDVFSKNLSRELAFSYHDHLKWCAFKIVHGYKPMRKIEAICYKRVEYKNDRKMENLFITQFYEIENVKEYLAYHSKQPETDFELSIYDALFTYLAYDVIDKFGCVLQKR